AGECRALTLPAYAAAEGLSLDEAVAYADSTSDLPMLEAVGHPVAVNPEGKLFAIARRRGWHVEHWSRSPGAPRHLLPLARASAPERGAVRSRPSSSSDRCRALPPPALPGRSSPAAGHGSARSSSPTSTSPHSPRRAGGASVRVSPASAAPIWPPSTVAPLATSSRSCRSRSFPATRSSASSTTA